MVSHFFSLPVSCDVCSVSFLIYLCNFEVMVARHPKNPWLTKLHVIKHMVTLKTVYSCGCVNLMNVGSLTLQLWSFRGSPETGFP